MALPGRPFARIFDMLKAVAPTAVAGLGGPFGPLIAVGMKKILGVDKDAPDTAVEDAVLAASATPETIVKLKEIEAMAKQHQADLGVRFEELAVQRETVAAGDRDSARKMAMVYGAKLLTPQNILAALFVLGYLVILGLFFSRKLEVPTSEAFILMLGVLTGGVTTILAFFFGSTTGSQMKTQLLAQATGKDT